ncbi:MAG: hypothetical protein M3N26_09755, partial [Pseudomonadota bacterium]|nr:hypothetical protein [Pseudomonadota bacterium]
MPSAALTPYLDSVLEAREVFWAGRWAPLARMAASTALFDPAQEHRLPSDMHGRFEVVLLLEYDLGSFKQWPLILDEALRLMRHDATLVLRYRHSPLLSPATLKHQIHCWAGGAVEPVFEQTSQDGQTQLGVRLTMPPRSRPQLADFSFALVSDGRRLGGIETFIDSVRRLQGIERIAYEILVCGPDSIAATARNWGADCRIVHDPGHFPDLGWITNKKNLCVQAAEYENILVAHDRY